MSYFIDKQEVVQKEEALRVAIRGLPDATRKQIFGLCNQQLKDPDTYAALNYALVAGLHHIYLGKWLRALIELLVFIMGIVLAINGASIGFLIAGVIVIIEIYELFRSQVIIQDFNNQVTEKIISQVQGKDSAITK